MQFLDPNKFVNSNVTESQDSRFKQLISEYDPEKFIYWSRNPQRPQSKNLC